MLWTSKLVPTEFTEPETGEPLYVDAKIRPCWYWTLRRWWLFMRISWRRWEDDRIGVRTAWYVACTLYPKDRTHPIV